MIIEQGLEDKVSELIKFHEDSVFDLIGAEFAEVSRDKISALFTLNKASQQAFGLMHGGIYAYLAESLASIGGWLAVDLSKEVCVGIEVNANHVRGVSKQGTPITATATPLHRGRTLHVWQVEFRDGANALVSVSRCTLLIKTK